MVRPSETACLIRYVDTEREGHVDLRYRSVSPVRPKRRSRARREGFVRKQYHSRPLANGLLGWDGERLVDRVVTPQVLCGLVGRRKLY